jgi:hypothetical protein
MKVVRRCGTLPTMYVNHCPTVCEVCHTTPVKQPDGAIRCNCPDKGWHNSRPVTADADMTALLNQKGFELAGCGWYYYGFDGTMITIFENGSWHLGNGETTIKNLRDFLLSLPDMPTPTSGM